MLWATIVNHWTKWVCAVSSEQLHIIQSHALEAGLKTANIVLVSGEVMRHNMETGNGISLYTTLFFLGFMHHINNSLSGISK